MELVKGQRAIITGGGTGLGFASAKTLIEHGAHVLIAGRRADVLELAANELEKFAVGGTIATHQCDVTEESQVEAAMAAAAGPSGRIDIVIANAGGAFPAPITSLDPAGWRFALDLNVIGTALTIKHAVPAMKENGGSIITMSSTAGVKVERWMAAYSVSKAAVEMLTKCAAFELSQFKIRVNGIRPGWHSTESNLQYCPPEFQEDVIGKTFLGRAGEPDDIGNAVLWLASPLASFVTGHILGVDGGLGVDVGEDFEGMVRMLMGDGMMDAALGRTDVDSAPVA
ncbi:SDR family oxidoreductase [Mycobacterium sp. WUMAC-067]|uniref:SDR family NAD(P)-dependent oxidoreductase n=1 Tax=unclassified Mycobacterium TaxID=2642494 RepID=UPI001CD93A3D|nr:MULTISPECIES: SDR family oxidoreductase [unclassified Mycobacterium]MCA2244768.1 SDR family oxidoreductase [Mycobacterium sp. WUMAC-067]MCA2315978.1 SDR family oxidoreductase [Mycobacterium sp. WUMAC-025]